MSLYKTFIQYQFFLMKSRILKSEKYSTLLYMIIIPKDENIFLDTKLKHRKAIFV